MILSNDKECKSVAYAWKSNYDACIIQNNKACENLLLYIFKHEISRKKN